MELKFKVKAKGSPSEVSSALHPGFKAVQNMISKKEGVSKDSAGAILASRSRNASKAAKKKNPLLLRVKG